MLSKLIAAGKFVARIATAKNPDGERTGARLIGLLAASGALISAIALSLGAGPELSQAIGDFAAQLFAVLLTQ